jgi:serine/threonine protein kinase/uncharacterized protein HemY
MTDLLIDRGSETITASMESLLGQAADDFTQRLNRGEQPDIEEYASRYPQIAALLRQVLPALQLLRVPPSLPSPHGWGRDGVGEGVQPQGTLGDFRIHHEIGRGGMGVVYEAEQISLGRRVALKVLPFAAALDSKQLQRFKNEAHAAAGLQHTNIVPVYFVGCERGVHFYAMQFVEGQTLAALIRDLRQLEGLENRGSNRAGAMATALRGHACPPKAVGMAPSPGLPTPPKGPTVGLLEPTGPYAHKEKEGARLGDRESNEKEANTTIEDQASDAETLPAHPRSSILDSPSSFFRTVANLGIQAAEALEHAHSLGVIHRDIKPGNLMVDARGNLWITDFGLAHCQGAVELTMSGDLLGTLRYMSPEQALAQRVLVDQRTDIYSLGATLYELLTLEPAYPATDRRELLRQIAFDDPKPPRRLSKSIPVELETIVLKAMEKNPAERYAAAQELADDLEHYLKNEPIRARRTTLVQRARKWTRRHRSLVLVGTVALLVVLATSVLSTVLIWTAYLSESRALAAETSALEEKDIQLKSAQASLELARNALYQIFGNLIQMQPPGDPQAKKATNAVVSKMLSFYEEMEAKHGSDPVILREVARAYQVMARKVFQDRGEREQARKLFARAFDIIDKLAAEFPDDPETQYFYASTHGNFGNLLKEDREWGAAAEHYKRNIDTMSRLASLYPDKRRYRREHAIGPLLLGLLLWDQGGHWEKAADYLREAIKLEKQLIKDFPYEPRVDEYPQGVSTDELDLARTYNALGLVLLEGFQRQGAEESFREEIKVLEQIGARSHLDPVYRDQLASAHNNLGELLHTFHDLPAAEEHLGEAIKLLNQVIKERPGVPSYQYALAVGYNKLGDVLTEKGDAKGAEEQYRLGLVHLPKPVTDVMPEFRWERANSLISLGDLLTPAGQIAKAEEAYQEGLPICKELAAHIQEPGKYGEGLANCSFGLAHLLVITGRTKQAKELCDNVLKVAPKNPGARARLAWRLGTCPDEELRDHAQALQLAEAAVKTAPTDGTTWRSLGVARFRNGDLKGAVAALEKSMKLANGQDESFNTFFLAMTFWRLGEKEQARQWYDQAVAWMKQNLPHDEELRRFRAEAEEVLSINHKDTKDTKKKSGN